MNLTYRRNFTWKDASLDGKMHLLHDLCGFKYMFVSCQEGIKNKCRWKKCGVSFFEHRNELLPPRNDGIRQSEASLGCGENNSSNRTGDITEIFTSPCSQTDKTNFFFWMVRKKRGVTDIKKNLFRFARS